jgi:flagellar biosynthetic protein FliQ
VTQDQVLTIMKEALLVALKLSLPLLIASMIIGLIIAIFQAATQIHEQTLTFVPKVIVIGLILLFLGSWMTSVLIDFMSYLFDIMKNFEGVL